MDSIGPAKINWLSEETHVLMNPRLADEAARQAERLLAQKPDLKGHLWVQSSGSSQAPGDSPKWLALSKKSFLVAAAGANRHLGSHQGDHWGLALPLFHVGGLSIFARAFLTSAKVSQWHGDWEPRSFAKWVADEKITLLSLVPTQIFDLVAAEIPAPPSLRAIVVGGARLEEDLYKVAMALGWPVLPSFGMTELCSQVATAKPDEIVSHVYPDLEILPHISAKTDADQSLWISSIALFTGSLQQRQGQVHWETPELVDGYWKTPDRAILDGNKLRPIGRVSEFIKIKGEGLDLAELRSRLISWLARESGAALDPVVALTALPDARDGHRLVLAIEGQDAFESLRPSMEKWNASCFPLERMDTRVVETLPRSHLGKILWGELNQRLS